MNGDAAVDYCAVGGILTLLPGTGAEEQGVADAITTLLLGWAVAVKAGKPDDPGTITSDFGQVGWVTSNAETSSLTLELAQLGPTAWASTGMSAADAQRLMGIPRQGAGGRKVLDAWWKGSTSGPANELAPATVAVVTSTAARVGIDLYTLAIRWPLPDLLLDGSIAMPAQATTSSWTLQTTIFDQIRAALEDKVAKLRSDIVYP